EGVHDAAAPGAQLRLRGELRGSLWRREDLPPVRRAVRRLRGGVMVRIYAEKKLNFTGHGVRLLPGHNQLRTENQHGLKKSLLRHEKAGHLVIEWDVPDPEKPAATKPKATPKPRTRKKPAQEPVTAESPLGEPEPETPAAPESGALAGHPEPEPPD